MFSFFFKRAVKPRLVYITDGANWALDWVGRYITDYVENATDIEIDYRSNSEGLEFERRAMIHFGSRYSLLGKNLKLHSDNRIFLTWLHGELDDKSPETVKLFTKLREVEPSVTQLVTSCQFSREQLIRANFPEEKIVVIPLGVDTHLFRSRTDQEKKEARLRFGIPANHFCVGSFQKDGSGWGEGNVPKPVKGPDVFLSALDKAKDRIPNLYVFLTGPSRGYVKNGLERLGIPFCHYEFEDYPQLVSCYHALDAYLISSRCEGGPLSLMESWATGVPLVTTRMGMPADHVRHRENGWLTECEDSTALADGLCAFFENPQLGSSVSAQGAIDVKKLDWRVLARQYYECCYRPQLSS